MRWLSDVEGCFFTYSCPDDQKVKCDLNLLRGGGRNWWRMVTSSYTHDQRSVLTWDQFSEMFHARYVPLVEMEILD